MVQCVSILENRDIIIALLLYIYPLTVVIVIVIYALTQTLRYMYYRSCVAFAHMSIHMFRLWS